jgi:dolichol-phosphate mannosyltransferase
MSDAELKASTGSYIVPLLDSSEDFFSLVVPTYNEGQNLKPLVEQVCPVLDAAMGERYEIIVVDDNSPDGTFATAVQLAEHCPRLKAMRRVGERGLATAVIRGWQAARGNILAVMDGDLQHPPAVLGDMVREFRKNADLVVASRYVERGSVGNWGLARRLLSRGAGKIAALILPELSSVSDPMSGYFALRRTLIQGIELNPTGYKILLEVLVRGRQGKVVEVPFEFQLRLHGETKVELKLYFEYLKHLLELRRHLDNKPTNQ